MKKIKLTEKDLTKIIQKVINEQEEERPCPCDTGPPRPECCPDMDEWMNSYSQDGRCYPVKQLYNEMGYKYDDEDNGHHDYEKRMEGGLWFYLRHYCRWNVEKGYTEGCVEPPIVQSDKINSDGCDILLFWEDEMSPINLGQGDEMIKRLNAWETAYSA